MKTGARLALTMIIVSIPTFGASAQEPCALGSRRELMVDDYLVAAVTGGARLVLHHPTPREVVIVHDQPWEGNSCGYHTVFRDGDVYRMYYKCYEQTLKGVPSPHPLYAAYAESPDGIHWRKPVLELFDFRGSKKNNIIWEGPGSHDFTPFKDPNPDCTPDARYKAVANGGRKLLAFKSQDAIHWTVMNEGRPVITQGAFDSQNLAFWDALHQEYRVYFRDFRHGLRDIRTATSKDFLHWTRPQWLEYPGAPREQLYTNQIIPYYRAPHIFLGFPTRYLDRGWSDSMRALPGLEHRLLRARVSQREGTALTDGLFMSSRDGRRFQRWGEAFIRPGLRSEDNWVYGDNYQNWGIVETKSSLPDAPDELSVYATESYWTDHSSRLRRFTLRIDGFVSMEAPSTGGEFVTKPLTFTGKHLYFNFSSSAAGGIRVELQDARGDPFSGFSLADCNVVFGDELDRKVTWKNQANLAALIGKPVRLRVVLNDADLYSFQFR